MGLPSLVGRHKKQVFNFIKDRIWKKENSLSNKFLSRVGKKVLIKSIVQVLPTYCIYVFYWKLVEKDIENK